jgi:Transposase IS66 family
MAWRYWSRRRSSAIPTVATCSCSAGVAADSSRYCGMTDKACACSRSAWSAVASSGRLQRMVSLRSRRHSSDIFSKVSTGACGNTRGRLSKNSETGKAINYSLKRWPALTRFLDDGRLCMSNNAAERKLRAVALGHKSVELSVGQPAVLGSERFE